MIIPEAFGALTVISLVFAVLMIAGAVVGITLWFLIDGRLPEHHGGLRRMAVLLLALIGFFSVLGSVSTEESKEVLRIILGLLRGAGLLVVWTLVVYDLVRYFDLKQQDAV